METFSKEDTKCMKALAVILMLIHHLWGFPGRIEGLKYFSGGGCEDFTLFIGLFGKICVSFFLFLGGYGLYISNQGRFSEFVWFQIYL